MLDYIQQQSLPVFFVTLKLPFWKSIPQEDIDSLIQCMPQIVLTNRSPKLIVKVSRHKNKEMIYKLLNNLNHDTKIRLKCYVLPVLLHDA